MRIVGHILERRALGRRFFATVDVGAEPVDVIFRKESFDEATWTQVVRELQIGDQVVITGERRESVSGLTSVFADSVIVTGRRP